MKKHEKIKPDKIKRKFISKEDGFLIPCLFYIFYFFEKLSLFHFIRFLDLKLNKSNETQEHASLVRSYIFPELWAVGNLLFALFIALMIGNGTITNNIFLVIFVSYAFLRVFEMLSYQINVLFFHRLNSYFLGTKTSKAKSVSEESVYYIKSASRTVILLIFNMLEYILQFSVVYAAVSVLTNQSVADISFIKDSFELFMGISSLEILESHESYSILLQIGQIEIVIGIFMNIVCLARFISILPEVEQKDYK